MNYIRKNYLLIILAILMAGMLTLSYKISFSDGVFSSYNEISFSAFSIFDLFRSLLYFFVISIVLMILRRFVDSRIVNDELERRGKRWLIPVFAIGFLILWFPCLLTFYPGGVYSDTQSSILMAKGESALTNHHPILYTMSWRFVFWLGDLLSVSEEGSLFIYTVFTAVFMAFGAAYLLYSCYRHGVSVSVLFLISIYFGLFHLIPLYIVSLWKDTPFSIITLVFSTFLLNKFWDRKTEIFGWRDMIIFCFLGYLFSFARNNGLYAFILLCMVIMIYFLRQSKKGAYRFALISVIMIGSMLYIRGPLFERLGYNGVERLESLGVPIQQVAYILSSDGSVASEDMEVFNRIMDTESWKEVYRPFLVDVTKWDPEFDYIYLNSHAGEFLKAYLHVILKNPVKAFKGYALITLGFWDATRQTVDGYVCYQMWNGLPYENHDKMLEMFGVSLKEGYIPRAYLSAALFGWLLLVMTMIGVTRHKRGSFIATIPTIGVWLTLFLATPIAFSMRYLFVAVLTLPIGFIIMIQPCSFQNKKDS